MSKKEMEEELQRQGLVLKIQDQQIAIMLKTIQKQSEDILAIMQAISTISKEDK